ncbi:MAG TPA: Crp/Fnr family transcriptional regulator [Puia sp.]|nr:Crp/Fnr family transcriptional regulator [Puia sp.]
MHKVLADHIKRFISIDDKNLSDILQVFQLLKTEKKQNLLTEGKICQANYFVIKGCLRLFFINDKGVEQTTHFAIENWWLADYTSFEKQEPSTFFLQTVEKSQLLALYYTEQEKMLKHFPQMERYFRLMHQRANAAAQCRIKGLYELSREESYRQFNKNYPEFVQRIPQYLLASFLGFTPEYLSEIRKKAIS